MAAHEPEDDPGAPRFPPNWGEPRPWRSAGVRGVCFAPLSAELDELFRNWVLAGHAHPARELKVGVVFRAGELVAKFFPPPSWPRRIGGRDTAQRAADLALAIHPLGTPRPLLAVGSVGPQHAQSLFVCEFVAGHSLLEVWEQDAGARAELPKLLAAMHERGIHHGDLHPENLLWNGTSFFVIDVTALRRGLHLLFARRMCDVEWARLLIYLGDVEGVREAFGRYAALRAWPDAETGWRRVLRQGKRLLRGRPYPPPKAPALP